VPHLGTAYTTIAADALARFMRLNGRDVWFLTGLDEHGQKVEQAAAAEGKTPQQWVDDVAPKFKEAWAKLNITYDDFIRTTEPRHVRGVQQFFERLHDAGYLYPGTYQGYYCVPDETFFTHEQLEETAASSPRSAQSNAPEPGDGEGSLPAKTSASANTNVASKTNPATAADPATESYAAAKTDAAVPLCPDCGRPLTVVAEENLFFRLSAFEQRLLDFYAANPDFIQPRSRRNEVVSFVQNGLKDLSVSRTTFDWGVPIPFAPGHVSYVWVDALINYITAVGYGDPSPKGQALFARRWPAQIHFVGKDIIRFHCVIWPAMLMAAGLKPPQKVFAHGFLLTKGEKMSKSKGNAMAPIELARTFSVDAYRYYFLSDVEFGADGAISLERILQVYNADLANSWGNLCSRALNMCVKFLGGKTPELWDKTVVRLTQEMGNPLATLAQGLHTRYAAAFAVQDYAGAMAAVRELVDAGNLYIEQTTPWALAKAAEHEAALAAEQGIDLNAASAPTAADRLAFVLYNLMEGIRIAALLFAPVMPHTSDEVWRRLGLGDIFAIQDQERATVWGGLPAGLPTQVGNPLFMRIAPAELGL
jgi:methionyl-tRNA synthetase